MTKQMHGRFQFVKALFRQSRQFLHVLGLCAAILDSGAKLFYSFSAH
jgi:hypothetical protein